VVSESQYVPPLHSRKKRKGKKKKDRHTTGLSFAVIKIRFYISMGHVKKVAMLIQFGKCMLLRLCCQLRLNCAPLIPLPGPREPKAISTTFQIPGSAGLTCRGTKITLDFSICQSISQCSLVGEDGWLIVYPGTSSSLWGTWQSWRGVSAQRTRRPDDRTIN
jgi:hypothetical protein